MSSTDRSMRTSAEVLGRLVRSARASHRVRAALLVTRDRDQALALLKQVAADADASLYHYSVNERRRFEHDANAWTALDSGAIDAATMIGHASRLTSGVVVFDDCTAYLRDEQGDARMRMTLMQLLSCETQCDGVVIVFLGPPESTAHLPSIIADQFVRLEVGYPRAADLERIALEEIAAGLARRGRADAADVAKAEAKRLATGVVGLTRSSARDALRDVLIEGAPDFERAVELLDARKRTQLARDLAMNVLETDGVEEPIGLDFLVEHLRIDQRRMRSFGPDRARGVLLIGPPGTGKTMLARAIGRVVGLPVVEFRIASLMNSLLGETERRFEQGFATLEAMSPNVVFIDEIEKAFGDSSERDGGTMMRCTGSLLSWLSDNLNPNYIVATSNSLARMGEIGLTMTRSERFDAAFFVDVPSRASREAMLRRWLGDGFPDLASLVDASERFSGADLRSVVKAGAARAEHLGVALSPELLAWEVERKRARANALYEEFAPLRRWGQTHCDPAGPTDD